MKKSELAPIILFVYNRLETLRITVASLQKNPLSVKSELFIFSDGAKGTADKDKVAAVRQYIKTIQGFKNIEIIEREKNYGLADSVLSGISSVLQQYDRAIMIEDDLECAPFILDYFNKALDFYKDYKQVYTITGYSFPTFDLDFKADKTYFLTLMNPWSWATWSDRWEQNDITAKGWQELQDNKKMRLEFNFYNTYNYSKALEQQMRQGINSWAIRWYFTLFKKGGLNLYPYRTLARNIGFDGSGTHDVFITDNYDILKEEPFDYEFTEFIEENVKMRDFVVRERMKRKILSLKDAKQKAFQEIAGV